jgi:CDP-diacylglycerol--glycerol-3-phosphate 3-phosphatidyltransferase
MNPRLNWPNVLTGLRFLLVPVFIVLVFQPGAGPHHFAAVAVFLIASLTDLYDGNLARKWGQTSQFGALMDPIADKALTGAALVCLSMLGEIPWWVTLLVMTREISITVWRFTVLRDGVVPASRGGKTKTTLQMLAIVAFLLNPSGAWHAAAVVVLAAAVVVTVVTGADYFINASRAERVRA